MRGEEPGAAATGAGDAKYRALLNALPLWAFCARRASASCIRTWKTGRVMMRQG